MGLSNAKVEPVVPVSDMAKAKDFYEGTLGPLGRQGHRRRGDHVPVWRGPRDSHSPLARQRGKSGGTIAAWEVDDLEKTVDELTANGVSFDQVDGPRIKTNEKGIAALGEGRMAWFKDPDGNIHAIAQM